MKPWIPVVVLAAAVMTGLATWRLPPTPISAEAPSESAPDRSAAPSQAPPLDELVAMSVEAFFDLDAVEEPLVAGRIDHDLLQAAVFHETNVVRQEHGLSTLQWDGRLAQAARQHAGYLIEHETLSHENTHDPDRQWPMDRVRLTGYTPRAVSENVAQVFRVRYTPERPYYRSDRGGETVFSYQPDGEPIPPHSYASFAEFLLDEWMGSPGHRANILRETSEELGVAVQFRWREDDLDEAYAVQVFAVPLQ